VNGTVWPNCADVPLRIYSLTHSPNQPTLSNQLAKLSNTHYLHIMVVCDGNRAAMTMFGWWWSLILLFEIDRTSDAPVHSQLTLQDGSVVQLQTMHRIKI